MDEAKPTVNDCDDVVKETTPDGLVQVPDGNHTQGRVKVAGQIGPKQNRPQVKSAPAQIVPSQIGPKSNRPHVI